MAVTVITTPGGASSNSYASIAEADAFHETQLRATDWTEDAETDDKARALITATRLLDENIEWDGAPTDFDTQALQWPRAGMLDAIGRALDDGVIPQTLKNATSELARVLLAADRSADLSSAGVASLTAGSVSITFDQGRRPERKVIPDSVLEMLALWGRPLRRLSSSGNLPLVRA